MDVCVLGARGHHTKTFDRRFNMAHMSLPGALESVSIVSDPSFIGIDIIGATTDMDCVQLSVPSWTGCLTPSPTPEKQPPPSEPPACEFQYDSYSRNLLGEENENPNLEANANEANPGNEGMNMEVEHGAKGIHKPRNFVQPDRRQTPTVEEMGACANDCIEDETVDEERTETHSSDALRGSNLQNNVGEDCFWSSVKDVLRKNRGLLLREVIASQITTKLIENGQMEYEDEVVILCDEKEKENRALLNFIMLKHKEDIRKLRAFWSALKSTHGELYKRLGAFMYERLGADETPLMELEDVKGITNVKRWKDHVNSQVANSRINDYEDFVVDRNEVATAEFTKLKNKLRNETGARLSKIDKGCLCFKLGFSSLYDLCRFWTNYKDGTFKAIVEEELMSEEIKNKFQIEQGSIDFPIISEEHFKNAVLQLLGNNIDSATLDAARNESGTDVDKILKSNQDYIQRCNNLQANLNNLQSKLARTERQKEMVQRKLKIKTQEKNDASRQAHNDALKMKSATSKKINLLEKENIQLKQQNEILKNSIDSLKKKHVAAMKQTSRKTRVLRKELRKKNTLVRQAHRKHANTSLHVKRMSKKHNQEKKDLLLELKTTKEHLARTRNKLQQTKLLLERETSRNLLDVASMKQKIRQKEREIRIEKREMVVMGNRRKHLDAIQSEMSKSIEGLSSENADLRAMVDGFKIKLNSKKQEAALWKTKAKRGDLRKEKSTQTKCEQKGRNPKSTQTDTSSPATATCDWKGTKTPSSIGLVNTLKGIAKKMCVP